MVASCIPCDASFTVSFSGQRVAATRRRRSSSALLGTVGTVNGRIAAESCAAAAAIEDWTKVNKVIAAAPSNADAEADAVFIETSGCANEPHRSRVTLAKSASDGTLFCGDA